VAVYGRNNGFRRFCIRELNFGPVRDSATTDTLSVTETSVIKTQSELTGDSKSALVETQEAVN
jgi:hypothetical protein